MSARTGSTLSARRKLLGLWSEIGVTGDPLHRYSLAHYLADLYEDPAQALAWDVRALDAADAMTDQRVQEHHAGLRIAGFYPSLHLNLAFGDGLSDGVHGRVGAGGCGGHEGFLGVVQDEYPALTGMARVVRSPRSAERIVTGRSCPRRSSMTSGPMAVLTAG